MAGEQNLRRPDRIGFGLLKHGELVGINRLVAMNPGLQVPTRKIASKCSRKGSRSKAADRRTLPIAVVNVAWLQGRFACSGSRQRLADWSLPGSLRNVVGKTSRRYGQKKNCAWQTCAPSTEHG